jgi:hypothetical protein
MSARSATKAGLTTVRIAVLRVPRDRLELLAARLVDQRGDFDRASGVIR